MSRETQGDGRLEVSGTVLGAGETLADDARIAIVCSRYHSHVMQLLLDGAIATATEQGVAYDVILSEGAFELGILSL